MQYQVPQFIEVEDKIVGPFTLKQFFYVAGAFFVIFSFFFFLEIWLWIIVSVITATIAGSFAFVKYNGRALPAVTLSALKYFLKPRLYLWQKTDADKQSELLLAKREELKNLELQLRTSSRPLFKRERGFTASLLEKITGQKEKMEVFRKMTGEREVARRVDYR